MVTDDPYSWHRAALAGEKVLIHEGEPQCGFYCRRFEDSYSGPKNRPPLLPARIFWEACVDELTGERIADDVLRCEIAGIRRDPLEEWTMLAGRPITEAEYEQLMTELAFNPGYQGPQRPKVRWLTDRG